MRVITLLNFINLLSDRSIDIDFIPALKFNQSSYLDILDPLICVLPMETNKFAPSDCILPITCGLSVWKNFYTNWYGEEWGLCLGYVRDELVEHKSKYLNYKQKYNLWKFDLDYYYLTFNYSQWFFTPSSSILLDNIIIVNHTAASSYSYILSDCLYYFMFTSDVDSLISLFSFNNNYTMNFYTYDRKYFENNCLFKNNFANLYDLLLSLPLYLKPADHDVYDDETILKSLVTDKSTICEKPFFIRYKLLPSGFYCFQNDFILPSLRNFKALTTYSFVKHFTNPIVLIVHAILKNIFHLLNDLLTKIIHIFIDIIFDVLLLMLNTLINISISFHIKLIELVIIILLFYLYNSKFILSLILSIIFYLVIVFFDFIIVSYGQM